MKEEIIYYCDKKIPIRIERDKTQKKEAYYTVLQNPQSDCILGKVIFGSTEQIVKNKCIRQLKKWKKEHNHGD